MRKLLLAGGRILTAPFRFILRLIRSILHWLQNSIRSIFDFFILEPEDTPLADTFEKATRSPTKFLQAIIMHLAELRWHLVRSALALLITTVIAFSFTEDILDWLAQPLGGSTEFVAIDITEPIGVSMRISLLAGFFVSLPYISLEILLFVAAGIKRRTRIILLLMIPVVPTLFAIGMGFAYYVMLPIAVPFLRDFIAIEINPRPESYVKFVVTVMFWIGAAFQFPFATFWLSVMGILRPKLLAKRWRIAVVLLAVLAAVITPTPDPVNMMIVFVPLLILYLLGLLTSMVGQSMQRSKKVAVA